MNKIRSYPTIRRRNFLKCITAIGITAAGGYMFFEYAPWLNYDEQAKQIRRPFERI